MNVPDARIQYIDALEVENGIQVIENMARVLARGEYNRELGILQSELKKRAAWKSKQQATLLRDILAKAEDLEADVADLIYCLEDTLEGMK